MNDFMIKPFSIDLLREKVINNAFPDQAEKTLL
jgi:hypothetical protein